MPCPGARIARRRHRAGRRDDDPRHRRGLHPRRRRVRGHPRLRRRPVRARRAPDRLERSTTNLRLGWSAPRAELEQDAARLLEARGGSDFDGCLRIVLTRGGRRLLITEPLPADARARAARVRRPTARRGSSTASSRSPTRGTCSRPGSRRSAASTRRCSSRRTGGCSRRRRRRSSGAPATASLATPPLDEHILASITRAYVIEVTGAEERVCTKDDLREASEAFLASTTREVQPVSAIEDIELEAPGERTQEAARGLRARIEEALAAAASATSRASGGSRTTRRDEPRRRRRSTAPSAPPTIFD